MKVKRMIKSDVDTFKVGDIIKVKLTDGVKVQAMAMQQEEDGMIFCLVDCLPGEYPMNSTRMTVSVLPKGTDVKLSPAYLNSDGTINYCKMITYLTECESRNKIILDDLVENREHFNLILSERVDHLKYLYEQLPLKLRAQAAVIDGKMTSKKRKVEREQAIEDMRTGKKRYLFATYSLAKEGLDIPRLDRLYLTTPQKDYAVIVQSVGRIARTFDGKEQPIAYDYVDCIRSLQKSFKQRCTSYRKCGCEFIGD